MDKQIKLFEDLKSSKPISFRAIHYLGSKLRVLPYIKDVIDDIDPDKNGVCDLFAGTGSVSKYLAHERQVVAVDIQNYSYVLCSALLKPISANYTNRFKKTLLASTSFKSFSEIFHSLIQYEDSLINDKLSHNLNAVCNFLENASLYTVIANEPNYANPELDNAFKATLQNLKYHDKRAFLATKYFGGTFFSYRQSVDLDAILSEITKIPPRFRNIFLAAVLSTASEIVNTVGKQFAQPIRPRNKNGKPKNGLLKQLHKDRNKDVVTIFLKWLDKYTYSSVDNSHHIVIKADFRQALHELHDNVKVIYADPPYTRDHYSRFYHGLETLSLMDYPKISKTTINGTERLSRGLYREDRVQSDFCIKSKARQAFEDMFKIITERNKALVLSYSPYDKSKGAHPRVVEIEQLMALASKYFNNVEVRKVGKFMHSKLNKKELHLEAEEAAELLIIGTK